MTLYERIELLCREKGVSKGKMCSDIGISQGAISDLKAGRKKSLSAQSLAKIAKYFGTSIAYLLGDMDDPLPAAATPFLPDESDSSYLDFIEDGYTGVAFPSRKATVTLSSDDFDELADLWNTLKDRPEIKMLFKSANGASKEQVVAVAKMLDSFNANEPEVKKPREHEF